MFQDWVGVRLYAVSASTHQTLARCNVLRSEKEHEAGGKYRLKINVYHLGSDGVFRGPGPGEREKVAHPLTAVKESVRERMTQEPGEESWSDWYAEAVHPDTGELLAICRFQHVIDRDRERLAPRFAVWRGGGKGPGVGTMTAGEVTRISPAVVGGPPRRHAPSAPR